ncbi:MAG: BON domain-containing protein [Methylococcaceae bacterium]|nr:BON domain-containing protein [Methylococcaceae bacterium]
MHPRLAHILLPVLLFQGCHYYIGHPDNLPNLYDRRVGQVALMDENIEINAREDLNNDPVIPNQSHVNVNAYNGTLLVTGEVKGERVHKQILEKMRILQGVKRVQDELVEAPGADLASQSNDSFITTRIKTELDKIHDPADFNGANIKVVTENGCVYLMGLVYKEEADLVTTVVQKLPGVTAVVKLFEYL